jgi:hypothetical protein
MEPESRTYTLDLESLYAAEFLDSLLEASERVGIRVVTGVVSANRITIVLSDDLPESVYLRIFESKLVSLHSGPAAHAGPTAATPAAIFLSSDEPER